MAYSLTMLFWCVIFSLVSVSQSFWDDLGVKWEPNVLLFPQKLPRTTAEAYEDGWRQYDEHCDDPADNKGYKGIAWMNAVRDPAVTLLFDVEGYIAGIQAGIHFAEAAAKGFPRKKPRFTMSGNDRYVVTAYFVEPAMICTKGRTEAEYRSQGTGNVLYFQNGAGMIVAPKSELEAKTTWVEGTCIVTKGTHYWYDISENMNCDELFPVYLLYNGGQLNGFGWAFQANLNSKYYEHPKDTEYPLLFNTVPKCLKKLKSISTMSVFLTSFPSLNYC